jgi:hypothetical protein
VAARSLIFIYLFFDLKNINISTASFSALGLILIYLGRIITKKQGSFYGKLHFSTIFISAFLVLMIEIVKLDKLEFNDLASGMSASVLISAAKNIYIILIYYINILWGYNLSRTSSPLVICLFGCAILSTLSEWILATSPPDIRSYLACADKFPSDFTVITGITSKKDNIEDKIDEIFKDKIIGIMCVTKSLVWVDLLEKSIRKQHKLNRNASNRANLDYRILKSPSYLDYGMVWGVRFGSINFETPALLWPCKLATMR